MRAHTHMHTHTCKYIHTHTHKTLTDTHILIHTHANTHTHTHKALTDTHIHTRTRIHTYTSMCIHKHTHTRTQAPVRVHCYLTRWACVCLGGVRQRVRSSRARRGREEKTSKLLKGPAGVPHRWVRVCMLYVCVSMCVYVCACVLACVRACGCVSMFLNVCVLKREAVCF